MFFRFILHNREVPNLMAIYDIENMSQADVKKAARSHFYDNADVRDERVIDMLLARGYIDLEDTMLYHKQKAHLMLLLEGPVTTDGINLKLLSEDSTEDEQFARSGSYSSTIL